jgi:coproporphyrinogen III oxidase
VTACLVGGSLLEKAAASVSVVTGELSAGRAAAMAARGAAPLPAGTPYAAAALSIVFHPASPHVPTLRGDVRLFYAAGGVAAYGGGADLTPSYLYPPDAAAFHGHWKGVCDAHAAGLYAQLKV